MFDYFRYKSQLTFHFLLLQHQNWELAARRIALVANGPKIVVEKSTLPVRTAHSMVGDVFMCMGMSDV